MIADDTMVIDAGSLRSLRGLVGREPKNTAGSGARLLMLRPSPPPKMIEYQRVSKVCPCCGAVTTPDWDDDGRAGRARRHGCGAGLAGADRPGNHGPRRRC